MNKKIVAGLLAGIATGIVATLLTSDKGRKARKKLVKNGSAFAKKNKRKFTDFAE